MQSAVTFPLVALLMSAAPGSVKTPTERPDAGHGFTREELMNADLSPLIDILSTSDGGFPFAKYKWEVPDLESYVDVPSVQVVNGLPVRFSAAVSKHDIPFLMDFYAKEFVKAGLFIPPPDDFKRLGLGEEFFQLTALDTNNLISYSVMFQATGANRTTVIMSQGYLQEWLKKKRNADPSDFAPLFPSAKLVVRTHSEGMDMMSYATDAPAKDVASFYTDTLPKLGWMPDPEEPGQFTRGPERLKVRAAKASPSSGASTAVMLERRTGTQVQ
jgi:hypothetical protein